MVEFEIPIVIFAFNRPNHLNNLLDSLRRNKEAKFSNLIVYIDGWRNDIDKTKVKQVEKILKDKSKYFGTVKILNPNNLGCKKTYN